MSEVAYDPTTYKNNQRRDWDAAAAGWKKWWEWFELRAQHVSHRLIEMGSVQPGHRVLDVATGIGEPAVTAARRVGLEGRVIATDQAPGMLEIAEERRATLGLENLEFKRMDAEVLDFPDENFDTVLCRWGLMFLPDLPNTLNQIRRVLRPGGRFATSIWGVPEKTPGISMAMGVIKKMIRPPAPPEDAPSMFKLSPPGVLEKAFMQAGFSNVLAESHQVDFAFESVDEYIRFLKDVAVVITVMLANETTDRQAEVWQVITSGVGAFTDGNGAVSMPSETILVVGKK